MCGILLLRGNIASYPALFAGLNVLKARGPDSQTAQMITDILGVGFARLHIQGGGDLSVSEQPYHVSVASNKKVVLVNGEIFNASQLISQMDLVLPSGASDCAVIPALLEKGFSLEEICRLLDGDFAIVVADTSTNAIELARDPYGVRPLFYTINRSSGDCVVSSELKGIVAAMDDPHIKQEILDVIPGTVVRIGAFSVDSVQVWHEIPWLKVPAWRESVEEGERALFHALDEAVIKRLVGRRGVGACLSGGLDSSLVAALAARSLNEPLHTFSVGMEGSPDLIHARLVAAHIGSIHHEKILTPDECLAIIPEVVRAIESFDITTVRASVGNYFVGKLIAEETPHIKVVLNGDGADEVLGGYLYMRAAPSGAAFEIETNRLLREIHRYDVLRSERCMAAHGLESRSPFLDRQFVAVARSLPTDSLRPSAPQYLEKMFLRSAISKMAPTLLPSEVLWRRKEAFSDGISRVENSWFEMARKEGERQMQMKDISLTDNRQITGEAFWYREIWSEQYPAGAGNAVTPAMWMPRFVSATDPSARTLTALYSF